MINKALSESILKLCNADTILKIEEIQKLWRGYGSIIRVYLDKCQYKSVVVKHVKLENNNGQPKGCNFDRSHIRKIKSYLVEEKWYLNYNQILQNTKSYRIRLH